MADENTTGAGTGQSGEQRSSGGAGAEARFRSRLSDFEKTVRSKIQEMDNFVRENVRAAVPPEVATHMQNSKREFLLAIRKLVDRELEKSDKEAPPKQ